ncbi:hypothetical protein BX661DRAFT_58080 [Kickxella alabastrina]|uniref:uncharacterized protein n=1 Tax=Kickxella alabastrina TaxID=61397 RepID=UPI002220F27D|nr:uncharacterized protein BX661DRAFT_58080 [Kickxella alabastrina]KAI7822765.1 hypothetical protein BX661DRAFT_58080 [Kickxella alabastrina]
MGSYKTLSSSLNWPSGLGDQGTVTLVTSVGLGANDGTVLIPHFLTSAYEQKLPAILVSFTQTYNHYLHIMRKMGMAKTKFKFVNALATTMVGQKEGGLEALPLVTRPDYTLRRGEWSGFFQWLSDQTTIAAAAAAAATVEVEQGEQGGVVLVVDGLCSLVDLGMDISEVVWFMDCCRRVLGSKGRIVVGVLLDEFTEDLVRELVRKSHYYFGFTALVSGSSRDISGQVTVVPGQLYCQLQNLQNNSGGGGREFKPLVLHYCVSDTNVQFFSPGQSHIVL